MVNSPVCPQTNESFVPFSVDWKAVQILIEEQNIRDEQLAPLLIMLNRNAPYDKAWIEN